jgi:hypothetical protein
MEEGRQKEWLLVSKQERGRNKASKQGVAASSSPVLTSSLSLCLFSLRKEGREGGRKEARKQGKEGRNFLQGKRQKQ